MRLFSIEVNVIEYDRIGGGDCKQDRAHYISIVPKILKHRHASESMDGKDVQGNVLQQKTDKFKLSQRLPTIYARALHNFMASFFEEIRIWAWCRRKGEVGDDNFGYLPRVRSVYNTI